MLDLIIVREKEGTQLLEEIKQIGQQAVYECGIRFKAIRDEHKHPKDMKWAAFCLQGCNWKKTRIYDAIYYVENIQDLQLSSMEEKPPERVIRPIVKLKLIEDKQDVWDDVNSNGGKPTAEVVERAVERKIMTTGHVKTKKGKPTKLAFNPTSDRVDWAKWTWNPVFGCRHGCVYCYARDFAKRQGRDFFKPEMVMHQLAAPKNSGIPRGKEKEPGITNVFVCSMADLFGEWVLEEWIQMVLNAVNDNPQWNYIFLTKNPKRLVNYEWPDHAWVGTTVDCQERVGPAEEAFQDVKAKVKFVSIEPFNEAISFKHLDRFNWVIIGGRSRSSGMPAFQPESIWVERIVFQARRAGCRVYFKPNLEYGPKEYPEST